MVEIPLTVKDMGSLNTTKGTKTTLVKLVALHGDDDDK